MLVSIWRERTDILLEKSQQTQNSKRATVRARHVPSGTAAGAWDDGGEEINVSVRASDRKPGKGIF